MYFARLRYVNCFLYEYMDTETNPTRETESNSGPALTMDKQDLQVVAVAARRPGYKSTPFAKFNQRRCD